jgi:hypothetical protein
MSEPMKRVPWARVCVPQSCGSMRASDKVLGVGGPVGRARRCCDRDQLRVHTCVPGVAGRCALQRYWHRSLIAYNVESCMIGLNLVSRHTATRKSAPRQVHISPLSK